MIRECSQFFFERYTSISELTASDQELLMFAQKATAHAYAPYSKFYVGAAALMENGQILTGTNQENISSPAGLCAERVVLAVASSSFPGMSVRTMAISYTCDKGITNQPVSPCGICRQSIDEFERKTGSEIRLILGGMSGEIIIIPRAVSLLPLAFSF